MRKVKLLLTGFLCAALLVPSAGTSAAVTINRHSMDDSASDSSGEESSSLDTKVDEITVPGPSSSHIEKEDVVEPADIVFVIDSTGSMASYIQNVSNNVETFSKYLEEQKVDVNMSVVEYRDITCDGKNSTKVHTIDGSPWHRTTAELKETLRIIKSKVNGGGDLPETLFDALGYVTDGKTLKFRSNAHKFVIVLSDANYKENNSFGLNKSSLLAKLKEQKINTSVITNSYYFDQYKDIIGETGVLTNINSRTFSDDLLKLADEIKKTIEIEVPDPVEPVTYLKVTCTGDNTIKVGNSAELKAIILPETADNKNVEWVVDDESIAGIDISSDTMTCTVTGKKEGKTRVSAVSSDGGFNGSYDITIISGSSSDSVVAIEIAKEDLKVTPSKKTINKQKSFNIKIALTEEFKDGIEPEEIDAIWEDDIDSITYRSSKSNIASVNSNGKVTAGKKKGKAIITTTVTLSDGKEYNYKTTVYVK